MDNLKEKLDKINLEIDEIKELRKENTVNTGKEMLTSSISFLTGGISDIITPILSHNSYLNEKITVVKRDFLLNSYINKTNDLEKAVSDLETMINDYYGNVLFNQLLKRLYDYPPEEKSLELLSNILNNLISEAGYKENFDKFQLILRMVERTSTQALLLLSNFNSFKPFIKNTGTIQYFTEINKYILTSPWSIYFATQNKFGELFVPIIDELVDSHYIMAEKLSEKNYRVILSHEGYLLYSLIKNNMKE
ncbi:hypothetical protein BOVMAS30_11460 [Streptococcus uberis]